VGIYGEIPWDIDLEIINEGQDYKIGSEYKGVLMERWKRMKEIKVRE
jgi:hypothetical protein